MSVHTDSLVPAPSLRWLLMPVAGVAVLAAIVQTLRRRAREPHVAPMSEQWLREEAGRRDAGV